MVRKVVTPTDEKDLTLEVATLPVIESENAEIPVVETESAELPVIEVTVEAPSSDGDKDLPDLKALAQKIAELEDKFGKLQVELSTLLSKKKKKRSKEKKVKCKCKGKTVALAQCKCKTKKLNK